MAADGISSFAEIAGARLGEIIAEKFSASRHAAILEFFENPSLPHGWTLYDSLAIWYCLGHICMMSAFYVLGKELPPELAETLLDCGLRGLLESWSMPKPAHDRFAEFNSTKLKSAWALWLSVTPILANPEEMQKYILVTKEGKECTQDGVSKSLVLAELYGFFSLFTTEILGTETPFRPMTASDLSLYVQAMPEQVFPLLKVISLSFLGTQNSCVEYIRARRALIRGQ